MTTLVRNFLRRDSPKLCGVAKEEDNVVCFVGQHTNIEISKVAVIAFIFLRGRKRAGFRVDAVNSR